MSNDAKRDGLRNDPYMRGSSKQRRLRRIALYGLGALIVVLGLAYIDGGQEPLRTIVEPVSPGALKESGQ